MNSKLNLKEADSKKIGSLRQIVSRQDSLEAQLNNFAMEAKNQQDPQVLFTALGKLIRNAASSLQRFNNTFPSIRPMLSTLIDVAQKGSAEAGKVEEVGDDLETQLNSLMSEENQAGDVADELFKRQEEKAKREKLNGAIAGLQFANYAAAVSKANLPDIIERFKKDIQDGLLKLAKQGIDPTEYFTKNPSVISDLRAVFQVIQLTYEFSKAVNRFRSKLASSYKDEGDAAALINNIETTDNALLTDFSREFHEVDFEKIIIKNQNMFNDYFLRKLFKASDVAGGGKFAKASARTDKLMAMSAQAGRKKLGPKESLMRKIVKEALMESLFLEQDVSDADFQAAMKDLQSDPATMTADELSKQTERELKQAAAQKKLKNIEGTILYLITAYGNRKGFTSDQVEDFKKRYVDLAQRDINRAYKQLKEILNILMKDLTNILDATLEKRIKTLVNFRANKVIPARENGTIPPEKADAYIDILNKIIVLFSKTRNSYGDLHKATIVKNPTQYKQWLETAKARLNTRAQKLLDWFTNQWQKIKGGEAADEKDKEGGAAAGDPDSIKNMKPGKINVALNQLRQKGISAKDITTQIDTAIAEIAKNAGPQRKNFQEKDLPVINRIKDEIVKILGGDFSNLIKEGTNKLSIHPGTYNIIYKVYNNIIKESLMGTLAPNRAELVYKWLEMNSQTEDINKYINYIENSERPEATKILIAMAKELKHLEGTVEAEWRPDDDLAPPPEPKEFELSDEWQEVPPGTLMPAGAQYRMDLDAEKTYAKRGTLKEQCEINDASNRDLTYFKNVITKFYPYAKEKLGFDQGVKVNLLSDPQNAKQMFGKTAHYNPAAKEIALFVDDRHPKDILRSFAHELVHHAQNCRGDIGSTASTEAGYAQKNPHMRRLEGEAYLLGNGFLVRDFEDLLKQNLMENKNMKGLTNEQLRAVLTKTLNRVMEESKLQNESHDDMYPASRDDQGRAHSDAGPVEESCEDIAEGEVPYNRDEEEVVEEEVVEEEVVEEEGDEINETFTSKKDRLLFEELTRKWAK